MLASPLRRCAAWLTAAAVSWSLVGAVFLSSAISAVLYDDNKLGARKLSVRGHPGLLDYQSFGLSLDLLLDDWSDTTARAFWGSFRVFARMNVDVGRDSNIQRVDSGARSSTFVRLSPAIAIRSDWDRHVLQAALKMDFGGADIGSSERYNDLELDIRGERKIRDDTSLTGRLAVGHYHIPRDDPLDLGPGFDLGTYNWGHFGLSYGKRLDSGIGWDIAGSLERFDYGDVNGVSRDENDVSELRLSGRFGRRLGEDTDIFIEPNYLYTSYTEADSSVNDSNRFGLNLGGRIEPSPLTLLSGRVGGTWRQYFESAFESSGSLYADVKLLWNLTPLMTVNASLGVEDQNSVIGGAASAFNTNASAGIDYALLDNLILGLEARFTSDDFRETDRTDDSIRLIASSDWLMNEYFFLRGEVSHEDQNSTLASERFENTQVMLRFGAKLCCLLDEKTVANVF